MHFQDSANLLMMPDYIAQIMLLQHQSFCGRIKVIPITAVDPEAIKFLERLGTLNAEDLLMHLQASANLLMMPDYIAQLMLLQHQFEQLSLFVLKCLILHYQC
ncbi:hypothetical protein GLYMA_17G162633v4 [Glycine max]|nr:hypothetical protein GLYMA_17G162633v4 [Glycine max]KAH1118711.1 hypothetical protein GYH30_047474 [Glycine max]